MGGSSPGEVTDRWKHHIHYFYCAFPELGLEREVPTTEEAKVQPPKRTQNISIYEEQTRVGKAFSFCKGCNSSYPHP